MIFRITIVFLTALLVSCSHKQTGLSLASLNNRLVSSVGNIVDTSLNIRGFRDATLAEERTGIFMEERFDPNKIPVLMIHGLVSEPNTWTTMVDALKADPTISQRFQFLFYGYSTGNPTIPSAAALKYHLDMAVSTIERTHNISMERRLVVIGHSMGGILAKSLVSETGDKLWDAAFNAPIEEFDLTDRQRQQLARAFRYSPRKYVKNVIFLATPHRGSGAAQGLVGKIGSALSAQPAKVQALTTALMEKNEHRLKPEFHKFLVDKVNSIATLRPDSPVTVVLADLPIDPEVEFHSIAGIRSRRKPSGDGIVSLESTYVDGAYCEVGVFSDHSVHKNEEAIDLTRMLLINDFSRTSDSAVVGSLQQRDLAFIRYRSKDYLKLEARNRPRLKVDRSRWRKGAKY